MDGLSRCAFVPAQNQQTANPGFSDYMSVHSCSPQSVLYSFPPTPLVPSPINSQLFAGNRYILHPSPQACNSTIITQECKSIQVDNKHDQRVIQIADVFPSALNSEQGDGFRSQHTEVDLLLPSHSAAMNYSGSCPVVLPPGAFVQSGSGNCDPPMYQGCSSEIPSNQPQIHSVYPINVMTSRETICNNPPFASVPMTHTTEPSIPVPNLQSASARQPPGIHLPEVSWSNQPHTISTSQPVFWGHYITDKSHGIFQPQSFIRHHSVVDSSSVVTPTDACPPCNLERIVSATPEFIHPRKPDVPRWLMSPPVGEQDPSIVGYTPMLYHNMRISSMTGIAIPVFGPVSAQMPIKNTPTNIEPRSICSVSNGIAMQSHENPVPSTMSNSEVAVYSKDGAKACNGPNISSFAKNTYANSLMTPDDFCATLKLEEENHHVKELLSPTDFDSGYDSSQCQREEYSSRSSNQTMSDYCTAKGHKKMECLRPDSMETMHKDSKGMVFKTMQRQNDTPQISDLPYLRNSSNMTIDKCCKKLFCTPCDGSQSALSIRKMGTVILKARPEHYNAKNNVERNCTCLFNAALNLCALSSFYFNEHPMNSHCKRHCLDYKSYFLNHLHHCCVCTKCMKKSFAHSKDAKTMGPEHGESKSATSHFRQPAPDFFNRWPDIPLPPVPEPESENNDCQSLCYDGTNCSDGFPLAASLFQNGLMDCCTAGAQDEDSATSKSHPIGVFWDIENCAVPTGKSAHAIVQRVREKFFTGHKETEFMCVCDINKESKHVIQDLNNAQVNVVHINATAKNAADDKLRQSIRRFAHNHSAPTTLVLITGDANFTSEVSDLRHRYKYFVVLIHPSHTSQSLKEAASTIISYEELVADLPIVHAFPKHIPESHQCLLVSNLPLNNDANAVRSRLRQLSENCGGRVLKLSMGTAILKFSSADAANRALKRIDGEDVFGHSIEVAVLRHSPARNITNLQTAGNCSSSKNYCHSSHKIKSKNTGHHEKVSYEQVVKSFVSPIEYPAAALRAGVSSLPKPVYAPIINNRTVYQQTFPHPVELQPHAASQSFGQPTPGYFGTNQSSQNFHSAWCNAILQTPQSCSFQSANEVTKESSQTGVKLTVSNIDAQLGVNAIQDILSEQVSNYCQVLDMKVRPHNRFTVVCDMIVPELQDASNVLQNLQRQKIGTKRVLVTLAQQTMADISTEDTMCLKRDSFAILNEVAGRNMPLYRFFSVFERRFQRNVKLDDLKRIQDVVLLCDGPAGREVSVNPKIKDKHAFETHLSSLMRNARSAPDIDDAFLLPVCKLHHPADSKRPPPDETTGLFKIEMGLREFSAKLHALLHSHNGIIHLDGFIHCYCAEYGAFPYPSDPRNGGVILEHQASYVPGVQIITSQPHCLGVKAIVWAQPQSDTGSDTASDTSGASRWKSPNLIHFSREVVELLKDRPYSCLPYDNFSSAYRLHFGHICRPSEYGFTRLSDLLTAIPHVLQIMGSLTSRILTLTHRAQVKRFTQEVVKILKTTPDRAILVAQMPELYNRTFNKVWRIRDYGVSVLSDLLDDIPEGHICTTGEGDNIVLSLPRRERSDEEKEKTSQFAREVVKILRTRPHYRIPFTEFVPAYHRHFGRQCKLSNYGFTKLIDLFEALPLYVQIIERRTERYLALTEKEQHKILSIQITSILKAQIPTAVSSFCSQGFGSNEESGTSSPSLPLACIPALFQQKYRFPIVPQEMGFPDLETLMKRLFHAMKITENKAGDKMVQLADRKPLRLLSVKLLTLLLDQSENQFDVDQLSAMYSERFKENLEPSEYGFMSFTDVIKKALPGVVKMDLDAPECVIHLKPMYKEARDIRSILLKNNGAMTLGEFNFAYLTKFHRPVDCEKLGFPTIEALFRALNNVFMLKGFGAKRTLFVRNHEHFTASASSGENTYEQSLVEISRSEDFRSVDARSNVWMPKVPPCMMPFWNDVNQSKSVTNSASTENIGSSGSSKLQDLRMGKSDISQGIAQKCSMVNTGYQCPQNWNSKKTLKKSPILLCGMSNSTYSDAKCAFIVGRTLAGSYSSPEKSIRPVGADCRGGAIITLPNGSTPIASTSSCSSTSSPKSITCGDSYVESSDESGSSILHGDDPLSCPEDGVSSSSHSPYSNVFTTACVGSSPGIQQSNMPSDETSPGRIQLAASFSTLAQS